MNLLGLYSSYTFAEALRYDLLPMEGIKALLHTYNILQTHSYMQQRTAALWIHLILGLLVLLAWIPT